MSEHVLPSPGGPRRESRPTNEPRPGGARGVLRLWFGFTDAVGRKPYLLTGVGLMALKYLLDVGLVYAVTGVVWRPFDYLNPIISMRLAEIRDAPSWLFAVLAVMTLPFMWIGASMSVRRAVDVGASAWVGIGFLVPFLNFLVMIGLAAFPSKGGATWSPRPTTVFRAPGEQPEVPLQVDIGLRAALLGVAAAVGVGLSMVFLSVYGLGTYGMTLFFMTPFVMGAVSAYLFNRPAPRPTGNTLLVAVASTLIAGTALLLFALEGIICLVMAVPIAMVIALLGALIGRAVATRTRTPIQHTAAMMLALPGIAGVEAQVGSLPVHEVRSAIEIEAPPEAVWPNVIGFSELPPPAEWVFSTGISYPMRARIEGEGVGAVRYCEFSTGPFVEPITAWEPPRRLAFDVSAQPPSMKEWSPFRHVHPPHLDSGLRSQRGEFRLIALPGGRTRLEGSTWYTLSLFPALYWKAWSDELLHRIHGRVLAHVKRLSEEGAGAVTGR